MKRFSMAGFRHSFTVPLQVSAFTRRPTSLQNPVRNTRVRNILTVIEALPRADSTDSVICILNQATEEMFSNPLSDSERARFFKDGSTSYPVNNLPLDDVFAICKVYDTVPSGWKCALYQDGLVKRVAESLLKHWQWSHPANSGSPISILKLNQQGFCHPSVTRPVQLASTTRSKRPIDPGHPRPP